MGIPFYFPNKISRSVARRSARPFGLIWLYDAFKQGNLLINEKTNRELCDETKCLTLREMMLKASGNVQLGINLFTQSNNNTAIVWVATFSQPCSTFRAIFDSFPAKIPSLWNVKRETTLLIGWPNNESRRKTEWGRNSVQREPATLQNWYTKRRQVVEASGKFIVL